MQVLLSHGVSGMGRVGIGHGLYLSTSIAALFSGGVVGLWFDPNDRSTLFQDVNATQPITAPGQTAALMLDKSKGLKVGSELVTNGDFSNGLTGWTQVLGAIAVVNGRLRVSRAGGISGRAVSAALTCVVGRTYRVTLNLYAGTIGTADLYIGISPTSSAGSIFAYSSITDKQVTFVFVATQTSHYIGLQASAAGADGAYAEFDNVSTAELQGYHAVQPTAAQRPTYGMIPYGGVRNLATASADGTNLTYWPNSASNSGITATKVATGIDTDGLPYADYAVSGTATVQSDIYIASGSRRSAASVGQTYTGSLISKLISGTPPAANSGLFPAVIGETAPTTYRENSVFAPLPPTGTDTLQTATKTFANAATDQLNCAIVIRTFAGATVNYTVRIKAVQFELGSTRTHFQFNYSKYNITEAGKATVGALFTDGIDDGMVTPSIDFSGADKMTVWAGVQKLSDASRGMLAELGTGGFNTFSLNIPNPTSAYTFVSYGSNISSASAPLTSYPAPNAAVIAGIGDISGDRTTLQVNGLQVAQSTADQGIGNYSNNPIYLFRRGGTTLPFNGIFTGLIARGAQSSAAQLADGNAYINSMLGAY